MNGIQEVSGSIPLISTKPRLAEYPQILENTGLCGFLHYCGKNLKNRKKQKKIALLLLLLLLKNRRGTAIWPSLFHD